MMESVYVTNHLEETSNALCGGVLQQGMNRPLAEFAQISEESHAAFTFCMPSNRKICTQDEASTEICIIHSDDIQFTDLKLGEGSTSEVYAAVWKGKHLALKVQRSSHFSSVIDVEIQSAMRIGIHPSLVSLVGVCTDLDSRILCYDLQHGGTLDDVLDSNIPDNLTPSARMVESITWMQDVLSALRHLHSLQVPMVHRDVKPGNLFFSADRKRLRLGDFGLCKPLYSMVQDEPVGSFRYMAPEAFLCEGGCNEKVDIWAAGLVMWACAVRSRPFDALQDHDAAQYLAMHGLLLPIECVAHPGLQNLIRRALNREPTARPSAGEMLEEVLEVEKELRGAELSKRRGAGGVTQKLKSGFKAMRSTTS
eukprot:CAMPEP_0196721788 /NCGR_PEP_ID=MMETSP1091-20130531/4272_1 /TAXON_ID=302021 /ORGANISM="Rhodomonas sp., Strain CCMP768" /LENGTH=365 /DNA_ID=CAMNT_0042063353 /DNA_START=65 /DNA_END=1162 /DNA_ORIENTATION=-